MTENEEAESVLGGLSGTMPCECGESLNIRNADSASCDCGVTYRRFKRIGWKVSSRTHTAWKALEKRLKARIVALEGQRAY
jgi:hypothetical protein